MTKVVCLKPSARALWTPSYLGVLSSHILMCSYNFGVPGRMRWKVLKHLYLFLMPLCPWCKHWSVLNLYLLLGHRATEIQPGADGHPGEQGSSTLMSPEFLGMLGNSITPRVLLDTDESKMQPMLLASGSLSIYTVCIRAPRLAQVSAACVAFPCCAQSWGFGVQPVSQGCFSQQSLLPSQCLFRLFNLVIF